MRIMIICATKPWHDLESTSNDLVFKKIVHNIIFHVQALQPTWQNFSSIWCKTALKSEYQHTNFFQGETALPPSRSQMWCTPAFLGVDKMLLWGKMDHPDGRKTHPSRLFTFWASQHSLCIRGTKMYGASSWLLMRACRMKVLTITCFGMQPTGQNHKWYVVYLRASTTDLHVTLSQFRGSFDKICMREFGFGNTFQGMHVEWRWVRKYTTLLPCQLDVCSGSKVLCDLKLASQDLKFRHASAANMPVCLITLDLCNPESVRNNPWFMILCTWGTTALHWKSCQGMEYLWCCFADHTPVLKEFCGWIQM